MPTIHFLFSCYNFRYSLMSIFESWQNGRPVFISLPENFPVLEAICGDMDVKTVMVTGYPGYGFFQEEDCKAVVDYMVSNINSLYNILVNT